MKETSIVTVISGQSRAEAESLGSIWARRAISIPAYLILSTVFLTPMPLWLAVALIADAVHHQGQRLPRTRGLAFFGLYLVCELIGIIGATLIWVGTLGGRIGGAGRYLERNAALQRWWTSALFNGGTTLFSMKVVTEGLELASRGPLILFVRHSSTADTVLTAALVANPHRLLLLYVLKRELLWDPCIDIVGRRLPNAFIDRKAPRMQAEIGAIAQLAEGLSDRASVLIYPEGTRFSPPKLAAGVATLQEKGKPSLAVIAASYRNVLPPRTAGPLALLDAAPDVDVVFVEQTGFEGAATFSRFWGGGLIGQTVRVRLRRFEAAAIPKDDREQWLFERWAEIDQWISETNRPPEPTP